MTRSASIVRLGLVAATLALAGCQSQQAKLAEHIARAESYMKDNKASEAVIEYKNALQIAPNDPSAHFGLAKAYLTTRDVRNAYWELTESVRLAPNNIDARLVLGQFLLLGGDKEASGALEQAEAVIALQADKWEAWLIKGRALETLKRLDDAQAAYQKALELQPQNVDLVRTLANFYVRRGDRAAAEPLFKQSIQMDPSARSYLMIGGFYGLDPKRDAESEAAYRKALEVAKDEEKPDAYQRLASHYYARERYDEAEAVLKEGIEKTGKNLDLIYTLARFYNSRGAKDRADAMIQQATVAQPNDVRPLLILSAYRGRNNDLPGALDAAERAIQVDPASKVAKLRKAELLVDIGMKEGSSDKLAQSRAIVDAVLAAEPSSPEARFVEAKLDLAEGKIDEAVAALRKVLEARPDWAQAHFLLASALMLKGDRQEARAEILKAVELDAEFVEARRLLTHVHAALGEHDLAIEEARKILSQHPDDHEMRLALAQSLVQENKPDEARRELEAVPLDQRDAEVQFALGRIDMLQNKLDFARQKMLTALEKKPDQPEILESLLTIDLATGKAQDSLDRLGKAEAAKPDNAAIVRLHGVALIAAGQGPVGEAKLRHAIELNPNDLASYSALARYYILSHRFADGIETYKQAVKSRPDSAPLRFTLGTLYESSGQRADAMAEYEEAVKLDPNLAVAKNNLAYLMAEEGKNLDRALDLAQAAKAGLAESPNAADTLGWVLLKKGIPVAAIGYLKEAEGGFQAEQPDLGIVRYHLALAYEANHEPDKAKEALERALQGLETFKKTARADGPAPADPPWVPDARSMLQRLSQANPPTSG